MRRRTRQSENDRNPFGLEIAHAGPDDSIGSGEDPIAITINKKYGKVPRAMIDAVAIAAMTKDRSPEGKCKYPAVVMP
jgi:hypothetical protein